MKIKNKDVGLTLRAAVSQQVILAKWSRSKETLHNWGDALNPYLIEKMSGKRVIHINDVVNLAGRDVYSVIGSVLDNNKLNNLVVWGSGMKSDRSQIPVKPARVLAVRGPLTRKKVLSLGLECPEIYGDPALVLPRFYMPKVSKRYKLGIIPHYMDKQHPSLALLAESASVRILDIESSIEGFVDDLCSCSMIASSSLHGLIAADAYSIPRVWLKFSDLVAGGDYKFKDYFHSVGTPQTPVLVVDSGIRAADITAAYDGVTPVVDIEPLMAVCPFKSVGS